ncbi:DUF6292 family protein [Pseudonocardia acaciae]|uniref:DUF6292 family protein n=1 Tax=Pseudonocardia acaciae TaxID=551276 RepID=UPI0012ED7D92|nr:DUF6292 family protein [Pseudonocardia acaciae]
MVVGYLSAVAVLLAERGVPVRALCVDGPDAFAGSLTLDAPHERAGGRGAVWNPTRLHWEAATGWSASLSRRDHEHLDAAVRYLPSQQVVPAPVTVAHLVVALRADPDTHRASALLPHLHQIDRRLLVARLSGFEPFEPRR